MIEFQSNSEAFGLNYKTDGLKCVWGGGGRGGGTHFSLALPSTLRLSIKDRDIQDRYFYKQVMKL